MSAQLNTGVLVTAPIRPNSPNDPIATAYSNEVKGGHHVYATLAERDAIIEQRRDWGMLVTIYNDGSNNAVYQLSYNLVDTDVNNNLNWVVFNGGSGLEIKYNIRPDDYIVVPVDTEYFVYGDLTLEGYLINYGKIVVCNGVFTILGGSFSNAGTIELISLGTQSGSGGISTQYLIDTYDDIYVPTNNEYLIYGDLTIKGNLTNDGKVVLIDGNLVMDGGTFSNNGTFEIVTLATQSGSGNGIATQYIIAPTDIIYVPENTEYLIYGDLLLQGHIINDGKVVVIDGSVIFDGGTFSNNSGLLQFVTVNAENSLITTKIDTGMIYSVPAGTEYLVWGDLEVKGDLINSGGDVVILNGDLLMTGGTYSNPGGGNLKFISLIEGVGLVNQIPYFDTNKSVVGDAGFYRIPGVSTLISTTVSSPYPNEVYNMGVGTIGYGTSSYLMFQSDNANILGGFFSGWNFFDDNGNGTTFSTTMVYADQYNSDLSAILLLSEGIEGFIQQHDYSRIRFSSFDDTAGLGIGLNIGMNKFGEYASVLEASFNHHGSSYSIGVSTQSGIYWEYDSTRFILPATDGSAGDVLTTDGSGNLSFTSSVSTGPVLIGKSIGYNANYARYLHIDYMGLFGTFSVGEVIISNYGSTASVIFDSGSYLIVEYSYYLSTEEPISISGFSSGASANVSSVYALTDDQTITLSGGTSYIITNIVITGATSSMGSMGTCDQFKVWTGPSQSGYKLYDSISGIPMLSTPKHYTAQYFPPGGMVDYVQASSTIYTQLGVIAGFTASFDVYVYGLIMS